MAPDRERQQVAGLCPVCAPHLFMTLKLVHRGLSYFAQFFFTLTHCRMSFNFNSDLGLFYFETYSVFLIFFLHLKCSGACCPSPSLCCFRAPTVRESTQSRGNLIFLQNC